MRESIPFADVAAFVQSLGADIDLRRVARVEVVPGVVRVTTYRLAGVGGQPFACGDRAAEVMTEIPIEKET
jgi:hypothetical protein